MPANAVSAASYTTLWDTIRPDLVGRCFRGLKTGASSFPLNELYQGRMIGGRPGDLVSEGTVARQFERMTVPLSGGYAPLSIHEVGDHGAKNCFTGYGRIVSDCKAQISGKCGAGGLRRLFESPMRVEHRYHYRFSAILRWRRTRAPSAPLLSNSYQISSES